MLPQFVPISKVSLGRLHAVLAVRVTDSDCRYRFTARGRGAAQTFSFSDDIDDEPGLPKYSGVRLAALGPHGEWYVIVYLALFDNSGGTFGVAHVFRRAGRGLVELGQLHSNQMFSVLSLGGGRQVLTRSYEIGEMAHASMPRWEEFYAVRHNRLTQVNYSPRLYRSWMRRLWPTLVRFPTDEECWAAYGVAVRRSGSHIRPKDAYSKILRRSADWDPPYGQTDSSIARYLRTKMRRNEWPAAEPHFWNR